MCLIEIDDGTKVYENEKILWGQIVPFGDDIHPSLASSEPQVDDIFDLKDFFYHTLSEFSLSIRDNIY